MEVKTQPNTTGSDWSTHVRRGQGVSKYFCPRGRVLHKVLALQISQIEGGKKQFYRLQLVINGGGERKEGG